MIDEKNYAYNDSKAPWTLWGKAQHVRTIMRGVAWVSTPSHGGLRVAEGVASKLLSEAARELAEHSNGYFWFEEDVACSIAFCEQPEWHRSLGFAAATREDHEATVRKWCPKYFEFLRDGVKRDPTVSVGTRLIVRKTLSFTNGETMSAGAVVIVKAIERKRMCVEHGGKLYRMPVAFCSSENPYLAIAA